MKNTDSGLLLLAAVFCVAPAHRAVADAFGSGANAFDIQFITIGNPGNPSDATGDPNPVGSVPYAFRIGGFEISEQMIDKVNALGGLEVTKDSRGVDKPATSVSWNEAARFVNWLNTSTGSPPAYRFAIQPGQPGYNANAGILLWDPGDEGYNPHNRYRNNRARYVMSSVHEWYKAAYFDPVSGAYFDFSTGSDSPPTAVASGTAAGSAVYNFQSGPADISLAGGPAPRHFIVSTTRNRAFPLIMCS